MSKCIVCGKETVGAICNDCKDSTDIEEILDELSQYKYLSGSNEEWDEIANELEHPNYFQRIYGSLLANELEMPKSSYYKIICNIYKNAFMPKASREWLYKEYEKVKDNPELSDEKQTRLKGIVLDALYKDYRFSEAEKILNDLLESDGQCSINHLIMADYYIKTRRMDKAEEMVSKVESREVPYDILEKVKKIIDDYKASDEESKKEYLPKPKENGKEVRREYAKFLSEIGVDGLVVVSEDEKLEIIDGKINELTKAKPIAKDQYPRCAERVDPNFNSFVAFDLETTGRSTAYDSIIEFGAIRIVNGEVVQTKEFTFEQLCKPYKQTISDDISELTGITKEDVKDKPEMWDGMKAFMDFVGDDILVGYNCMRFDSRFLERAGRYASIIIENEMFDVMKYAKKFEEKCGFDGLKLDDVIKHFGIENEEAHRALADAVTTAKVFLELRALDSNEDDSLDDLLSSIQQL